MTLPNNMSPILKDSFKNRLRQKVNSIDIQTVPRANNLLVIDKRAININRKTSSVSPQQKVRKTDSNVVWEKIQARLSENKFVTP